MSRQKFWRQIRLPALRGRRICRTKLMDRNLAPKERRIFPAMVALKGRPWRDGRPWRPTAMAQPAPTASSSRVVRRCVRIVHHDAASRQPGPPRWDSPGSYCVAPSELTAYHQAPKERRIFPAMVALKGRPWRRTAMARPTATKSSSRVVRRCVRIVHHDAASRQPGPPRWDGPGSYCVAPSELTASHGATEVTPLPPA